MREVRQLRKELGVEHGTCGQPESKAGSGVHHFIRTEPPVDRTEAPELSTVRSDRLVTVAVPTFERSVELARAVDSLLDQDYSPIEIVIGDNASTDNTESVSRYYERKYTSVRYVRQSQNLGPTPNFESLRSVGSGEYFMYLGDDDWLDPAYISRCVAELERDSSRSLVAGLTCYHRDSEARYTEPRPITIDGSDGPSRLLSFYRSVRGNGVFYGVVPAWANETAPPLRNVQGGDMLHVAALAYLGNVATIDDVFVHRTVNGMSVSLANVAATLGLGWFQAQAPQIAIAYWVFRDVAWDSALYRGEGRLGRLWLGIRAGSIVFVRFVPKAVFKFLRLGTASAARRVRRLRRREWFGSGPETNA